MYRQGDILIVPIAALPVGLDVLPREGGRAVLAHGEATGHAHAIVDPGVTLFRDPKRALTFLRVTGNAAVALTHDEHGAIALPPGNYRIVRQREYRPEEIRTVLD